MENAPELSSEDQARATVLSLFAGAGGLDLGLESAGFRPVACLDTEARARETLQLNRPDWFVPSDGDVNAAAKWLTPGECGLGRGDLDLLAGGPPCQPFSKAAQWSASSRQGMRDPRAEPVRGMLDLVQQFLPKAILIENVAGYLSGKGNALPTLQRRLARINRQEGTNYKLQWWIVDAAHYGVPQHRQRAIAVATRDGRAFDLPSPTHAAEPIRAWDALHDLHEDSQPEPQGSWTALLPSIPEGGNYQYLTAKGDGTELFGWRTRYWSFLLKLAKDRPSWTLPASPGPNTGPFHWDNRPLSVRERLRLQSFPDEWRLAGSLREQYVLAGNATPPLLAEVLGLSLRDHLGFDPLPCRQPQLLLSRVAQVPEPGTIQPVPDSFLHLAGPRAAHPGAGLGPAPRRPLTDGGLATRA